MSKVEFLTDVFERFLERHPKWSGLVRDKRGLYFAAGRELPGLALLYVDFSVRPDNFVAGHGVGWAPSTSHFHQALNAKVNPPIQPRDGSLRRIATLEDPRDFRYEALRVSAAALCKPFGGFDLSVEPMADVMETILREIEEVSLPYLCLMLEKRHRIAVTPAVLGDQEVPLP